ncbi:hypothetical protein EUGRSUZ_F02108 [Eucalyptus grandis]|uniref:non-specific serine/threonine protein kinase n=2 Tax=Eucalyptus grandis TaxID=71139 RepID=A0A059BR93_EUCGR|nr:hypothetical protein EUGRSUZ_F02108 [Eucalyptus grandis]
MINMTQSQGKDDLHSDCSNLFNCGNIQGVGYPFWGGNRPKSCGRLALQLACEDNTASITISNVKYKVLDFYPSKEVLQIVRDDFSTGICSPNFTNTVLDPALFSMDNGYSYYTFFYGCPSLPPLNVPSPLLCTISGTDNKNVYVANGTTAGLENCFKSVVVPLPTSQTLFSQFLNNSGLAEIVQQGFGVRLGEDSAACRGCANSKGACGYDISKNTMVCYCPDGSSGSAKCAAPAAGGPQGQPSSEGQQECKAMKIPLVSSPNIWLNVTFHGG